MLEDSNKAMREQSVLVTQLLKEKTSERAQADTEPKPQAEVSTIPDLLNTKESLERLKNQELSDRTEMSSGITWAQLRDKVMDHDFENEAWFKELTE